MEKKKKFKLGKKSIIIILIVALVVAVGAIYSNKGKKSNAISVDTGEVEKKKLVQVTTATGNIEANYRNDIALNPAQKVIKVFVKEGQIVKKGDILVKLDDEEYRTQLEKQQLNLQNANLTLSQLQGTSTVNERKNAANAVSQAELTLQNAKNNYSDLKRKFDQSKSLYEGGYISKNDYDAADKALKEAGNTMKNAELALTNSKNSLSNISVSTDDKIASQRNQLALIQADIKNLQNKIEDCNIKANVNGKIVKMDAKEDQYPKTGDMIIVDDVSKYKMSLDINQYDAVNLKKGQKATVKLKGVDKKYPATVTEVGQVAQTTINTNTGGNQEFKINVKITLNNSDDKIKAGYEGDAEIILNERASSLAIGFDGIKEDRVKNQKYVYVVDANNKVSKRYIKSGLETEYDVEVLEGLKEGEKYVINPPENLKEGDIVSPRK
ncbi:HlyD family secretion protein [Clostridium tetanomorphum]|uniref:HlyD family efflux transporter periplasmic adaptor subunit n=1 Tax=Clostridium tetanomorphum TaxID=1553 RepID=A0A923E885_CLOTT|nr:biotin/lipoyl-binding protein [Clostridium tetanomorphum]KAJ48789.1 membrane-associated protein [Clostridium tetanomorphum DSM 665]KAJ52046.1 membrane-associated protein [Clostridium tetanomorphum DSM 665]MBC2397057.1 HlyD family efflux transporter periplasmic adaptor subunit [Clostridium tetanomorphum]MBP1862966.1 HlyD family secretion protein [Clostridium tetanomorphum]NRS82795.1 HlyD family secretion protein [Clostridium tetanomorphum]